MVRLSYRLGTIIRVYRGRKARTHTAEVEFYGKLGSLTIITFWENHEEDYCSNFNIYEQEKSCSAELSIKFVL